MRRTRCDGLETVRRGLSALANGWAGCWGYPSNRYRFVPLATCHRLERFGCSVPLAAVYSYRFGYYSSATDAYAYEWDAQWVV